MKQLLFDFMKDVTKLPDLTGKEGLVENVSTPICGKKRGCDNHTDECKHKCQCMD